MADQDKELDQGQEVIPSNDAPNFFDMSDDDVMALDDSEFLASAPSMEQQDNDGNEDSTGDDSDDSDEDLGSDEGDGTDDDSGDDTDDQEDGDSDGEDSDGDGESDEEKEDDDSDDDADNLDDEDDSDKNSDDATKQLEELFAPFKANGRMISVKSVDEAKQLMQMGANYNKKMAGLKPAFKVAKMLENNKLLDENTVSYLIDLHNGKPEAIEKLIQDSKFDVDNYDSEKDADYAPSNDHTVTDEELALNDVFTQIRETDTYQATMNLIGGEWDDSSKSKLVANPNMILKLNEHMGNGLYQKIADEIGRKTALGQLTGLSDLEAYFSVGQQMLESGQLEDKPTQQETNPLKAEADKAAKAAAEEKRKAKKRAAKPAKRTQKKAAPQEINPFDMPDDEFEKLISNQF